MSGSHFSVEFFCKMERQPLPLKLNMGFFDQFHFIKSGNPIANIWAHGSLVLKSRDNDLSRLP